MDIQTIQRKIGARIKTLRRARGFTQMTFSEAVGLSNNYLSDVERGNSFPKADKLVKMAEVLSCSADDIFCDVIPRSETVKSDYIYGKLSGLSPDDRRKAYAVLEAFIVSCESGK